MTFSFSNSSCCILCFSFKKNISKLYFKRHQKKRKRTKGSFLDRLQQTTWPLLENMKLVIAKIWSPQLFKGHLFIALQHPLTAEEGFR